MSIPRVLERLARLLVPRQMILLAAPLGGTAMGVRGAIVQLRCALVVFVMRSVVIVRRHIKVSRSFQTSYGLP